MKHRLEQDGIVVDAPEHWETWQTKVYMYSRPNSIHQSSIPIPIDIQRHLNLKHKDQVIVAIKIP